jgi:predicted phosphodiesterase
MWRRGRFGKKYRFRCKVCDHSIFVSHEQYLTGLPETTTTHPDTDPYSQQLFKTIERMGLTPEEAKRVIRGLLLPNTTAREHTKLDIPDKHVRFGAFADAHIGHMCFREDVFDAAVASFRQESVDFVLNAGDTLEGMSGREGHIYELLHMGYSEQMKEFGSQFEKFGDTPVYSIEAQNSHSGWFNNKANAGVDIGEELQKASPPYQFVGYDDQDFVLDSGLIIRLTHPGGGTAYAISYRAQKYIESLSGGKKPHIVIQGHFHKALYIFYRNIHFFDAGCLQEQSPYLKKLRSPAMLGYWVIDVKYNKTNWCCEVTPKFYPFYE